MQIGFSFSIWPCTKGNCCWKRELSRRDLGFSDTCPLKLYSWLQMLLRTMKKYQNLPVPLRAYFQEHTDQWNATESHRGSRTHPTTNPTPAPNPTTRCCTRPTRCHKARRTNSVPSTQTHDFVCWTEQLEDSESLHITILLHLLLFS